FFLLLSFFSLLSSSFPPPFLLSPLPRPPQTPPTFLPRTFSRIVRHIPSRSLKLNRRRRNRLFHFPAAMRTLLQMRPAHRLNLLRPPMAFRAFVLVQWHYALLTSYLNSSVYHAPPFASRVA